MYYKLYDNFTTLFVAYYHNLANECHVLTGIYNIAFKKNALNDSMKKKQAVICSKLRVDL